MGIASLVSIRLHTILTSGCSVSDYPTLLSCYWPDGYRSTARFLDPWPWIWKSWYYLRSLNMRHLNLIPLNTRGGPCVVEAKFRPGPVYEAKRGPVLSYTGRKVACEAGSLLCSSSPGSAWIGNSCIRVHGSLYQRSLNLSSLDLSSLNLKLQDQREIYLNLR